MRILIIEDDLKIAEAIKTGLEKVGYAVDHIADGEAGRRRIEINHADYDLVVLDLMLPGQDGFQICQAVRETNINIPILVLTAKLSTEDKVKALDSGADDYLVKPFSFEELLARVRAILRRPEPVIPIELKFHDITLNTVTRKVFRGSKEIPLTLKEYGLLEYFMRHPGQVLNREQILFSSQ